MKPIHPRALLGICLLPLTLLSHAAGSVQIELVEVPASEAAAASSLESRIRPLTLSEQFATTRVGATSRSSSNDAVGQPGAVVTIFECPELWANAASSPDRTALVIELARKKAYLMIDGMMVLETPVAVAGSGTDVPLGWYPVSARARDRQLSQSSATKASYWLKLGESNFGIHAGDLSGYAAAGGCVRFPEQAIDTVFRHAAPGTMVYICSTWLAPIPTGSSNTSVALAEPSPEQATVEPAPQPSESPASVPASSSTVTSTAGLPEGAGTPAAPVRSEIGAPPSVAANVAAPSTSQLPPPVSSRPGSTPDAPGHQIVRVRDLLGAMTDHAQPPSKPLTPVSGQSVSKAPVRRPNQVEVLTLRSLLGVGGTNGSAGQGGR